MADATEPASKKQKSIWLNLTNLGSKNLNSFKNLAKEKTLHYVPYVEVILVSDTEVKTM